MHKTFSILFFCCFVLKAQSQKIVENCDSAKVAAVRGYFAGYSFKYMDKSGIEYFRMEREYFLKDFQLSLTDSSYQVIKFIFTADLVNGDLVSLVGDKNGIEIESSDYLKTVKKISKKSLITVDNIFVLKNGKCFKIPPFICYMVK